MRYHIALGKSLDLPAIEQAAAAGQRPGHAMADLARALEATVHQPGGGVSRLDALRAHLGGTPEHWALARRLAGELGEGDTVYCTGEDVGIPVATLCGRRGTQVVIFAHNMNRLRARAALRVFRCAGAVDLWLTNARPQERFLRQHLGLPAERVVWVAEQTDTRFFTPGPASAGKRRPVIASVGLERRDYRTLAAATHDLNVEVRISGFSRDAKAMAAAFPEVLPENMDRRFYEWPELVQLYRDADVVVVSVVENLFCAGLTSFLEAGACGRPVVITRTAGLQGYLGEDGELAVQVPVGDAAGMRRAVLGLLAEPGKAREMGLRARQAVLERHGPEAWVERVAELVRAREGVGLPH